MLWNAESLWNRVSACYVFMVHPAGTIFFSCPWPNLQNLSHNTVYKDLLITEYCYKMNIIWVIVHFSVGIGPVLGLVFIPLIGSASDRCSSSYGRRRPFIWLLSLGVLMAMLIIPHADVLAAHLSWGGNAHPNQPLQVGLLILGVVLLDFCSQVCFTPLEALLSDLYGGSEECARAFATFSFMASLGSCMGYLLSLLDWSSGPLAQYLGGQAKGLFMFLILIFVFCVLVTMKASEEEKEPATWDGCLSLCYMPRRRFKICLPRAGSLICVLRSCWSVTPAIFRSYCHVPYVMRRLCAAQLSSWMAIVSFMLFYTDFVGEGLYQGVPSAAPGTVSRQQYDEGETLLLFINLFVFSICLEFKKKKRYFFLNNPPNKSR